MLTTNNLIGFGVGGGRTKVDSTYITTVSSATSATEHTYNDVSIGAPDSARLVVVVTEHYSVAPSTTVVTVGGISATLAKQNISGSALGEISIWYVNVPTGETAQIIVTKAGNNSTNITSVYALYGLESFTPENTSESDADPAALSLNVTSGSFGLGGARVYATGTTFTWVGATEDYDGNATVNHCFTTGSVYLTATESPRTITCDYSSTGSGHNCAAFATWR